MLPFQVWCAAAVWMARRQQGCLTGACLFIQEKSHRGSYATSVLAHSIGNTTYSSALKLAEDIDCGMLTPGCSKVPLKPGLLQRGNFIPTQNTRQSQE